MNDELPPGAGHNQPPPPNTVDDLLLLLQQRTMDMEGRIAELSEAALGKPKLDRAGAPVLDDEGRPVLEKPPRTPAPTDDKSAGKLTEFVKQCSAANSVLEERRKEAKQPYLDLAAAVDAFFNGRKAIVQQARAAVQAVLDAYVAAKRKRERELAEERTQKYQQAGYIPPPEPEAKGRVRSTYGAVATATDRWEYEVTAYDKIPLAQLRPYFNRDHVEQAIRGYMRANKPSKEGEEIKPLKGVRFFLTTKAAVR